MLEQIALVTMIGLMLSVAFNSGAQTDKAEQETAAIGVLADYYAAFSTLDVQAVLPYFHEPSVFIGPGPHEVFAASNGAVLTTVFTPIMEDFRGRGFGRSELSVRNVELLSATATLVTGVAIRYKVDGHELERVGVTYVLHKPDTHWKIAVLIVHDPNEVAP